MQDPNFDAAEKSALKKSALSLWKTKYDAIFSFCVKIIEDENLRFKDQIF